MLGGVVNGKVGEEIDAGLPNITGGIYNDSLSDTGFNFGGEWPKSVRQEGALHTEANITNQAIASVDWSGLGCIKEITFNAKDSNPIYGASETVQMAAHFVVYWKRVG